VCARHLRWEEGEDGAPQGYELKGGGKVGGDHASLMGNGRELLDVCASRAGHRFSRTGLTRMCRNAGVWIAEAMSAAAMGEPEGRGWDVKGERVIELGAGE